MADKSTGVTAVEWSTHAPFLILTLYIESDTKISGYRGRVVTTSEKK